MAQPTPNPSPRAALLARGLTVVIALLACLRAMLAFDPVPGWGLDPYAIAAPAGAFGPREAALMDVLTLLLAGLVLLLAPPARWKPWLPWAGLLVLVGAIGLVHGLPDGPRPADLSPALAWLAAIAGAGAIVRAASDVRTRRTIIALLAGFTAMLVAKGLVQLLVEHPATVAQFEANRAQMLAAQGLEEGAAGARAFERRLSQPEITGWIGFSNVTASFMAAGGVALAAMALGRHKAVVAVAGLGALTTIALVIHGSSKGAMAAVALGLGCVALGRFAPRAWRRSSKADARARLVTTLLAIAVLLGPIVALVARGMVGEAVGELSLLFRWFYVEAASRIALDHPLLGVGPGGFKDAYAVAKNPISPENAASPHSVLFDAAATMGLLVAAGVLVLLAFAAFRAAAGVLGNTTDQPNEQDEPGRLPRLALVAGPALAVVIGVRFEMQTVGGLTQALSLAWLTGLAGWVALAWAAWRASIASAAPGAAAAGLVLLAHGQIEMTPVLVNSASLWAAWIGLAVAWSPGAGARRSADASPAALRVARYLGGIPAALALVMAILCVPSLWAWQRAMVQAAGLAQQPVQYRDRLEASGGDRRVFRAVAEELSGRLGVRVEPGSLSEGLRLLALQSSEQAARALDDAVGVAPADGPTLRHASHAWLVVGLSSGEAGARARALALAEQATRSRPASGENFHHLAHVLLALGRSERASNERSAAVLEALAAAEALNPSSPSLKFLQFEIAREAGLGDWARRSAAAALEADDNMRLDRLGAGLSERQRARAEAYLNGG